jgi:hypothetical protein
MKRMIAFLLMMIMCANMVGSYSKFTSLSAEMCVEVDQKQSKEDKKESKEYLSFTQVPGTDSPQPALAIFKDVQIIYLTPVLPNQTPPPDVSC